MGHCLVLLFMQTALMIAPASLGNTITFPSLDLEPLKGAAGAADLEDRAAPKILTPRKDNFTRLTHNDINGTIVVQRYYVP